MPKKQKRPTLKQKAALLALAFLLALAGSVSTRYYLDGIPKYQVGECLLDAQEMVFLHVDSIKDGKYHLSALILFLQLPVVIPVREMNAMDTLVRINCDTGEPLDAAPQASPQAN